MLEDFQIGFMAATILNGDAQVDLNHPWAHMQSSRKCCVPAHLQQYFTSVFVIFVCVEVLRPNQPNGVMSSAVSLPNHTFTGQA